MPITLGLLVNPHRARELEPLIRAVSAACARRSLSLLTESGYDAPTGASPMPAAELTRLADALLVLGGDGTVLHAAPMAAREGKPILSVHAGNLGFLSETVADDIDAAVGAVTEGRYEVERRMTLSAKLIEPTEIKSPCGADSLDCGLALNDVVITRGSYSRMIRIRAWADGTLIGGFDGDGLIIASPTGSTGYALSTGGPVAHPEARCIQLAPICPHASQSRQIILPDDTIAAIDADCPSEGGGMLLTLDGRAPVILGRRARIVVSKSEYPQTFIRLKQFPFFERLREKLGQWNNIGRYEYSNQL